MKIRTDFVTNSSSSSFVCEKTSTFQVSDVDGNVSDMTFYYESFESYFDVKKIQVPDIINKYLLDHYIKTGKTASPKRLMDSLVKGEQTPMIKEFMDSVESQYIKKVLDECGGVVTEAAKRLGVHRSIVYRKLNKTRTEIE